MYNVNFRIYDRLNAQQTPMTGYCLPFDKFTFVPDFTNVSNKVSDKKVIWNFGDGTFSNKLTAYHSYDYPGKYPVTLTVFDSGGNGSTSTYLSVLRIYNAIEDIVLLTSNKDVVVRSGDDNEPIFLTRFNSHRTSISGLNTVINVSVSGNLSPFYTSQKYNSEKYAHLYSTARFAVSSDLGLTIVDSITTTNDPLYAVPALSTTTITIVNSSVDTTYLAGSSGQATFYYIEDYKI